MPLDTFGGDDDPTLRGDDRIIHRARKRFLRCKEWYDEPYRRSLEDTKFAHQDDRNHYGWPDKIYADRDKKRKPCLTINITEVHNRLIINEAMENRASPRVSATGGKGTADAAEGMQALVDRTENISTAMVAYRNAIEHQVDGGFGYVQLETEHVSTKSFNQDVYIRSVPDPRAVYLDPEAWDKSPDGSAAQFGFVFERMSRDQFNRQHPAFKDKIGQSALGENPLWVGADYVLRVMYYERAGRNDELICFKQADGSDFYGHRSDLEKDAGTELVDMIIRQIDNGEIEGQYRDVITQDVNWYLIGGDCILKRGDQPKTRWIGEYIPIIPFYGIKTVIEGKMDCAGHTRCQISPQQMLNYNASGQVQFGALQSRTPYIGPIEAFETNEQMWATSNTEDYAYLAYDSWVKEEGEDGRPVEAPKRQDPPQTAPAYAQGMQDAERWSMMVTGQFQAQMGEEETQAASSGKAITQRQRQGHVATYHFIEHQYDAYRYIAKQLIGIYPKLYDVKRILHVEGEDMTKRVITIDPDAAEAFRRLKKETETAEEIVFNPLVGEYAVVSDPGPSYATQRQQASESMERLFAANKELAALCGDLYLKNGDFKGAQEMADRVKKELKNAKPYLFDDGPAPGLQALQAQIAEMTKLNSELMTKLADLQLKLRGRDEKRDIDAYNADTNRLKAEADARVRALEAQVRMLTEMTLTPAQRAQMEHDVMRDERQMSHEIERGEQEHVFDMIRSANDARITAGDAG